MTMRLLTCLTATLMLSFSATADQIRQTDGSQLVQVQSGGGVAERIRNLSDTLQIEAVLGVMREEGMGYGESLAGEMFPGKSTAAWRATVEKIYDQQDMRDQFEQSLQAELAGADPASLDAIQDFFASARGQRILMLEIEARRALLDKDTEEAAKFNFEEMVAVDDPRLAVIREFAVANDLIEMNVAGALNANLAFFKGMASGGGFAEDMSETEMLSSVWEQEAEIRSETESWLFPYLALAYQPLSDEDMAAYLAFSLTQDGKILNAAVFAAFNDMFTRISSALGHSAAKQMRGEDI